MNIPSEIIESISIHRGSIFHSTIFQNIDHGKFFVIIGENDDEYVGFFFINSCINSNVINKPEQQKLQYKITKDEYSFLDHDSYIDCAKIKTIAKTKLSDSLNLGMTTYKDDITDVDMDKMLTMLRNSKLYNNHDKKTFFK